MAKKSNKRISFQEWVEQNVWGLVLATALVVSVGGIVEI
ncbi:MAG TPA: cytochrome-c oxidase, cbb3-type subunit II, partial [Methylophaga sp.]|nr:cytochrome-c oxidase, cbb3-type subunit II [Methylophaga sp.]